MVRCPFCGVAWVDNTIFCGECGQYLLDDENRATDPLETYDANEITKVTSKEILSPRSIEPIAIRLKIGKRQRKVEIPLNKIIYLGRIDPNSDVFPDVDLSEHAPAKSISRRHASLRKESGQVLVEDVGSVNGTFLNGKRLDAFFPEILSNGDLLHLGKLGIEIEFLTE